MNKNFLRLFFTTALVSALLAACTGTANPTTEEKKPLRFGWSLYSGWYPLVLAQELGLFEKNNVDVEIVLNNTLKETTAQLASGLVDGGTLVLGDALLEDVGNSATVVMITDNSLGADQVVASREIMETQDIRGKRIGLSQGKFGEIFVREMLKKYNVSIDEVQLVEVPPELIAKSIPGDIDLGHTYEPYTSQALARGNGIFFTSTETPGLIVDVIAFNNSFIQQHPENVRNFINAWFEAVEYWQANPEQGNAIIAEATGQNINDVNFAGIKLFDRSANLLAFQPGADRTSVLYTAQLELEFLISAGLVTKALNIEPIFDPSYLQ